MKTLIIIFFLASIVTIASLTGLNEVVEQQNNQVHESRAAVMAIL